MLDLINRGRFLEAGVLEQKPVHEPAVDIDVDIFVDRGRNEETRMLPIVGGQVRPAAAERNAQG
jgi:hypothetical protein